MPEQEARHSIGGYRHQLRWDLMRKRVRRREREEEGSSSKQTSGKTHRETGSSEECKKFLPKGAKEAKICSRMALTGHVKSWL